MSIMSTVGEDDDQSFVSIADFFSLLSIAFIYFAIFLAPLAESSMAVNVERAANPGAGAAMAIDPYVANVSVFSDGDRLIVRVILPLADPVVDLPVPPGKDELIAMQVESTLTQSPQVKVVNLYMPSDEEHVRAYRLRDRLGAVLREKYAVRLIL